MYRDERGNRYEIVAVKYRVWDLGTKPVEDCVRDIDEAEETMYKAAGYECDKVYEEFKVHGVTLTEEVYKLVHTCKTKRILFNNIRKLCVKDPDMFRYKMMAHACACATYKHQELREKLERGMRGIPERSCMYHHQLRYHVLYIKVYGSSRSRPM